MSSSLDVTPAQARTEILHIRLTPEEKAAMFELAHIRNTHVSKLVRDLIAYALVEQNNAEEEEDARLRGSR